MTSYLLRRALPCFAVFVALSAAPLFAGDRWPEFRGPTGDGHADAHGLPIRWSETENVVWKTAIHDKGWSSPVVWGDQIWMTTARADGKEMFGVCVDLETGKIIHDVKLLDVAKPAFCPSLNSYASPTPVIEAGRVYLHFGSYGTFCLDTQTAKVLWSRRDLACDHWRAPGRPRSYSEICSSPSTTASIFNTLWRWKRPLVRRFGRRIGISITVRTTAI